MRCSDCGATVDKVFPVLRKIGKTWGTFTIGFVCKGCFAHYGYKPPPNGR